MRTSCMTRAAISLNTAASIGELWISPSVGTGRVLPGPNLEVVASGTDLEADEIADAGEVADIGMPVDRPAALAPGARRQFDFSDRVGGDRERQVRPPAGIAIGPGPSGADARCVLHRPLADLGHPARP